ncbi:MAG: hypothetical protein IJQ61_08415 [Bacteroidales bacterium]|nr:hypothetical protein [Bacteroidales bacterium]MBR0285477.1 hypothetical protein [Bacteroidales bacterium]
MKKMILAVLALSAVLVSSCNKDGESGSSAKVSFRKANIAGAGMLALAQGSGAATKAEGDITVGPKALYTVSEDGSMVEVTYNVDVEGANGEVAESIRANLIISPGFVFPVGEGWLWLANCHYDVKGGWNNYPTDGNKAARHALSKIINDFSAKYHDRHGAHYLIRKSDGALFEWTLEAGAPDGMDDGFKQPTFLNGWFHQLGKNLFVRTGGWAYDGVYPNPANAPSLVGLMDKGNTLDAVNILGDNITCWKLYPAGGTCLGGTFGYPGAMGGMHGIIAPPSFEPVLLQMEPGKETLPFLLSIGGKLYYANTYQKEIREGDDKEGYWTRTEDCTDFYNLTVSGSSVSLGNLICSLNKIMDPNQVYISTTEKLSWWDGNEYDGTKIYTLDPKAGTVSSRTLPEHYPFLEGEYVNGVAYAIDGTTGYWECDLSKDAAEYVALDWSSAAEYQGKIVPGTLRLVRFEAASLTLQFVAYMTNGTELNFYTSVVGADRGRIKTNVGSENNAGMVVTTMVRLN